MKKQAKVRIVENKSMPSVQPPVLLLPLMLLPLLLLPLLLLALLLLLLLSWQLHSTFPALV